MKIAFFLLLLFLCNIAFSQVKYMVKAEAGFLLYNQRTTTVDPGPNWKGYFLEKNTTGIEATIINGLFVKNKLFLGVGTGYLNFAGKHAAQLFGNVEYIPLSTKLSPLFVVKAGGIHFWNQYKNGVSTSLLDFSAGLNFRIKNSTAFYFSTGYNFSLQAGFIPFRLGYRF